MKKIILSLSFVLISVIALSQTIEQDSSEVEKFRKNEISYQFPLSFGYNRLFFIKDKVLFGVGGHLGFLSSSAHRDLAQLKVFTRNLFHKNKLKHLIDYDLGLFWSFDPLSTVTYSSYGIHSNLSLNVFRFRLGYTFLYIPFVYVYNSYTFFNRPGGYFTISFTL